MTIRTKTRKVMRTDKPYTFVFNVGRRGGTREVSVEACGLFEAEAILRNRIRNGWVTWVANPTMDFRFLRMTDEEHADFLLHPNVECMDREDPEI